MKGGGGGKRGRLRGAPPPHIRSHWRLPPWNGCAGRLRGGQRRGSGGSAELRLRGGSGRGAAVGKKKKRN